MSPPPPPSAAEAIAGNQDLLSHLLSFLPVKPLLRFKSVNKLFFSLISHPHFSLLHSRRHSHHPSSALLFLHHHQHHNNHHHPSFSFVSLSPFHHFFPSPPPFHILQSSHGLLIGSRPPNNNNINNMNNNDTFHVINPTTSQSTQITLPPRHHPISGLALGFDPSTSDDFYLISVYKADDVYFSIDVYSSGAGTWREAVASPFKPPFDVEFERGVFCEGRVHWLSHTEETIVFDLERECVERLKLPSGFEGGYMERFRYFGESCGHLHLVEIRTNCVREFEVLELRGMEWFVRFRVDLDVVGRGFEEEMFQDHCDRFGRRFRFYAFSILAVVRGEEDGGEGAEGSVLVVSVPGKVIAYNFETRVSRLICDVGDETDRWLPFKGYNAFQFIESLYCLS